MGGYAIVGVMDINMRTAELGTRFAKCDICFAAT